MLIGCLAAFSGGYDVCAMMCVRCCIYSYKRVALLLPLLLPLLRPLLRPQVGLEEVARREIKEKGLRNVTVSYNLFMLIITYFKGRLERKGRGMWTVNTCTHREMESFTVSTAEI